VYAAERCGAWAEAQRGKPLAPEVLHHAKRAVVDWHAALYPGAVVPPATLLEQALADELNHGEAFLALGKRATTRAAALINGTAAHTVEVDDIYRDGIYHPGAPTIAAALAMTHSHSSDGISFVRAVVVGYEISTRIGAAMGRAHYKHWHNTGTIGCFGAAAAAAEILKLNQKQFSHALATVATFAAALQQAFRMDSMSKPLHAGRAAEAGVTAALAAQAGVTGSLDCIEGFGRAMGDGPDWEKALATLGRDFHITKMTFKNHACCGHTFAAIDGALEVKKKLALRTDEIQSVKIGTYRAGLEVAHYEEPRTPAEGRFSLKYVVATALTHGSVRLAAFEDERLNDKTTRALMKKMTVALDPELDAAFPGQRAARVSIQLADGRSEAFLQPTRKGDPDLPLSDKELEEKFLELAVPVLGDGAARKLLERLWRLETQSTLA
jgi:2-methylcitrate dehydratase PrpD